MANIFKLFAQIGADTKDFDDKTKQVKSKVKTFQQQIQQLGGMIGVAFGVRAIIRFGVEINKLAGISEGVEQAFNNLNKPDLLANLREATRGTVSNLELMQKAVQAKNFKVPLDKLASFFEFATKRAAQTGESVDYLVNSLVTGIGRKSVLVMDNLGISAVELQEEVKKVGDFGEAAGNIIQRELDKAGDVVETGAQKTEKLGAAWDNLKVSIGKTTLKINEAFSALATGMNNLAERISFSWEEWTKTETDAYIDRVRMSVKGLSDELIRGKIIEKIGILQEIQKTLNKELAELEEKSKSIKAFGREWEFNSKLIPKINSLTHSIRQLSLTERELEKLMEDPKAFREFVKSLKDADLPIKEQIGRIEELEEKIKDLKDQKDKTWPKNEIATINDRIKAYEKEIEVLNNLTAQTKGLNDEIGEMRTEASKGTPLQIQTREMEKFAGSLNEYSALIKEAMVDLTVEFAKAAGQLIVGAGNLDNFFASILSVVGDYAIKMGELLIAQGIAMEAFRNSLNDLQGIGAIAAGIALVAIGASISGLAGSMASSGLSSGTAGGGGSYSGGAAGIVQGQTYTLELEAILKGENIYLSSKRYSDNILKNST